MRERDLCLHLLRRSEVLGALDRKVLEVLADRAQRVRYPEGAPIFFEGDLPDGLYVVVSGEVRITTASEEGREIELNRMRAGEVFGEIALLDGLRRTASASAGRPAELLRLPRPDFLSVLERYPRAMLAIVQVLCQRLRHVSNRVHSDQLQPLPARLAGRLLELSRTHGIDEVDGTRINRHLPQAALASWLGCSRQSVNKHLMEFQRQELILVNRARVTITDTWGLKRVARRER